MATKDTTPDLTEFHKLSRPKRPPCYLGLLLSGEMQPTLSTVERGQLKAALSTDRGIITSAAIVEWLKARGHDCNNNKVSNHRRGVCTCG